MSTVCEPNLMAWNDQLLLLHLRKESMALSDDNSTMTFLTRELLLIQRKLRISIGGQDVVSGLFSCYLQLFRGDAWTCRTGLRIEVMYRLGNVDLDFPLL